MKCAFLYQDDKSGKFWTVDFSGVSFCVHYGKIGAIGKYEVKEFDNEQECEKEAKKLIQSKVKKGYREDPAFDFEPLLYIDSQEYGLHPKTSHPRFAAHFTDDFYYDCGDEEAPFGSDEGSDTLRFLEEKIRKNPSLDFSAFPEYLITAQWGMRYVSPKEPWQGTEMPLNSQLAIEMQQSDMVTYATAFAQIKITGKLSEALKQRALGALKRFAMMYFDGKLTEQQQKMYDDLLAFPAVSS